MRNLRLQLRIQKIIFAVIFLVIASGLAYSHFHNTKSVIVVDGEPVACVKSEKEAEAILEKVKTTTGCDADEVEFKQNVTLAKAPRGTKAVSRHKAMREVQRVVSPLVARWAIIADGKPVVAVPDRETAGEVIDRAKLKFGKLVDNLAEEPQFKENVTVDIAAVPISIYKKTAEEALEYVFAKPEPVEEDALYAVESGDVAVTIAREHDLSLNELIDLNPGVNLDRLQIGQKINVKKSLIPKPKLTVVVRDQIEQIERIEPPIQRVSSARLYTGKSYVISAGKSGEKRVRYAVIYENGKRIGREIVSEEILREPTPKRVAIGIKPRR